jgi:N-acetylglucosamine kinase-like BadF-type ATPase
MTQNGLLLAVDGGGTKTHALVTDLEGKVLARGLGPSSNLHNVGLDESCRAMVTAIERALSDVPGGKPQAAQPGWRSRRIAAACFGLSGVDAPEDEAEIARWVRQETIAERFLVVNDAELVLAGGTPEGWGVALVSGTGSVCLGRAADGRTARVGGWGPLLGDEGSGYAIATEALRAVSRSVDGREQAPALVEAVLRHWSLADATALIRFVHAPTTSAADIAGLAPVVLEQADQGDAAARVIFERAACELARQVEATIGRLGMARPPLALAGGMLNSPLRAAVVNEIGNQVASATYVSDPPLGAVVLARRLLSAPPPGELTPAL